MAELATPYVAWWALVPLLVFSAGGLLLLTVASLVRRLPDVLAPAWTVLAGAVVLVALVFGAVNLPSVSVWTVLGGRVRLWLTDARRLSVFNWTMATLLLASLIPVVMA